MDGAESRRGAFALADSSRCNRSAPSRRSRRYRSGGAAHPATLGVLPPECHDLFGEGPCGSERGGLGTDVRHQYLRVRRAAGPGNLLSAVSLTFTVQVALNGRVKGSGDVTDSPCWG